MPDNLRKVARDHYVSVLMGQTAAEDRVTTKRQRSQDPDKMPAITILTGNSDAEPFAMGSPPPLSHEVELVVQLFAVGSDIDDQLDDLAAEVNPLIINNPPAFAQSIDFAGLEVVADTSGDRTGGSMPLKYALVYKTPGDDFTRSR